MNLECHHLHYHLQREPIPMEDYIMLDKLIMKRINKRVRKKLKAFFVGWVVPIGGMFAGAYTLINLMRYILICIYTLAN